MSTSFVFTLTVSDGTLTDTDTVTVTVRPNRAPTARAGTDQSVTSTTAVTLDGSGSSDPDGDTLTYSWAHTSGTPAVTLTGATTASPTFTAPTVSSADPAPASLVFTLTVSDGTLTATDTVTITVSALSGTNTAPTANAGPDQSVTSGDRVDLSGSGTDPDGDHLLFTWSQLHDNPSQVTLSAGLGTGQVWFTAPAVSASSSFVFTLTASDGTLTAIDTVTITVNPRLGPQPGAHGQRGGGPDGEAGDERDPGRLGEHRSGHGRHVDL